MENNKNYDSISFGLFLLFVGTLALLTNMNLITWRELFDFVLRYWPVLIILAGVKLVGDAQLGKLFGFVVDVIFFTVVILGLIYAKDRILPQVGNDSVELTKTETVGYAEFPDAISATYVLNFGAADFKVADSTSDKYISMTGPKDFQIAQTISDTKEVRIETKNIPVDRFYRLSSLRFPKNYTVDLGVPELNSTMELILGASEGNIVLDEMKLNKITTKVGAGTLTLDLTNAAIAKDIDISVGAGKTTVRLHNTDKIRVNYSLGAGSFRVKSLETELDKEFGGVGANGVYETSPTPDVEFNVSIGAGAVEIVLD